MSTDARPEKNNAASAGAGSDAKPARNGGKARLGKTLGSHVDPAAAAFPVNLLSSEAAGKPAVQVSPNPLQSSSDQSILLGAMSTTAVFWDRDNTLIEDPGYLSDPDKVKLLPGAARALCRLSQVGFQNVIITNQSAIARGLLTEADLERIHTRMHELLAAEGARVDAVYYCPYLDGPEAVVEQYRMASDLRKPSPGMLAKASLERQIDLAASWMVGNSLSDTQAGRTAGCRTILVANGEAAKRDRSVDFVAASLDEAVDIILKCATGSSPTTPIRSASAQQNAHDETIAKTAQEMLSFMRMVDRRDRADDFSLSRLVGIIVQMLAVAVLVWAVYTMVRGELYGVQIVRFLFALALQVLALTCFILPSRK